MSASRCFQWNPASFKRKLSREMPSPKGFARGGAKHKRKKSPLVPSSPAQDAQGPPPATAGPSGAVAKRPNSRRKVARVGPRLQEELLAAIGDYKEAMSSISPTIKRLKIAEAMEKEWHKQFRKWTTKELRKTETGGRSFAAEMRSLQEWRKREGAVQKAERATNDARLALAEAEARMHACEAAFLRCQHAYANRSGGRK